MGLLMTSSLLASFYLIAHSIPTPDTTVAPTSEWPWHNSWFEQKHVKLGPPDFDNARQVLALSEDGKSYEAVCDDLWTDKSALALCKIEGYQYGRRTSVKTDLPYVYSSIECYEDYDYVDLSIYQKPLFVIANAHCAAKPYSQRTMPCSASQAAAVYCYDDPWFNVFHNVQLTTGTTDFSLKFMINFVKLGKSYNALSADPLYSYPALSRYEASACGRKVELALEEAVQESAFLLSGHFDPDCDECLSMMLDGEELFENICADDN